MFLACLLHMVPISSCSLSITFGKLDLKVAPLLLPFGARATSPDKVVPGIVTLKKFCQRGDKWNWPILLSCPVFTH